MPLAADELVADRYRVLRLRGRGGMAEVHVAHDERLGRDVALKVLTNELVDDAEAAERLRREAATVATLNHPNVVTLHDVLDHGEDLVLVMELVEGPSLAARLAADGPLPVAAAVAMARQLTAGLAAAHDRGLVHRDVSPANVLFAATGEAKLADFGIARVAEGTATTEVLGTVHHVAPERIRGGPPDRRSDLYGLGSVLFQALTGVPPFPGDNAATVVAGHLEGARPHPAHRRAEVPPALDALVVSLLAVEPGDRPVDAHAVLAALDDPALLAPATGAAAPPVALQRVGAAATTVAMGSAASDPETVPSGGGPGRGRPLVFGLVGLATVLALASLLGAEGDATGPVTATSAEPTPVPTDGPAAGASATAAPDPAPTTPAEAVARMRRTLVEGRADGLVGADGLEELEGRIGELVRTVADVEDEPAGRRAQEVDRRVAELRRRIEEVVDDGELDPVLATELDDQLDELAALYGVDGLRGNDGRDDDDDDD